MSDDESDSEVFLSPEREKIIDEDIHSNLDVLNQKTVNFEDLLNELVRRGCLSFEEKFKILSGIKDETTSNKTIPEKCNELYQTLIRKHIPYAKVFKCWEETGNTYLTGRFDTHFSIEGRDSKSLKFSKFKALPSHRTEFLTHLFLRNLQLSPKNLLKCLRKSTRLQSIRIERVKVPHGGRAGDDPSTDFDQPLMLPNLKEFYFEEVTQQELMQSIKEVNIFLDELNLKPILFFGLNSNMAWDAGIYIHVRMRGVTILKMKPSRVSEVSSEGGGGGGDTYEDNDTPEYVSMLRRRPAEFGGFINPDNCSRVSLYECYLPKLPFPSKLTHLTLVRCRVSSFDPLIAKCSNLVQLSLYGEYETNNISQFDLSTLSCCKDTLKRLSLGFMQLTVTLSESFSEVGLSLDKLCIDCCKLDENANISEVFKNVTSVFLIDCSSALLNCLLLPSGKSEISDLISVSCFRWEENNSGDTVGFDDLFDLLHKSFKGNEPNFQMERVDTKWVGKKGNEKDLSSLLFELFNWNVFCDVAHCKGWFDLPFKKSDENDEDGNDIRRVFKRNL